MGQPHRTDGIGRRDVRRGRGTRAAVVVVSLVIHATALVGTGLSGPASAASPPPISLSVGGRASCGVTADGALRCWSNYLPSGVIPSGTFTSVAMGENDNACAIRTDETLTCWGAISAPPGGTFLEASSSSSYACAVRTDATLSCWGNAVGAQGQTTPPIGTFLHVAAGWSKACGIRTDHTLACWGSSHNGQLNVPGGAFTKVAADNPAACALATTGAIACWGVGGTDIPTTLPGTFTDVSVGGSFACGIRASDASVECWGKSPTGFETAAPPGAFASIVSRGNHSCGVRVNTTVVCWGDNSVGALRPTFRSPPPQTVVEGLSFSHQFVTTEASPRTFAVTGGTLPDGVTLDPVTGLLAGIPEAAGEYPITVSALTGLVNGEQSFTLRVRTTELGFEPLPPARIEDSRAASAVGPFTTPWGPQTTRDVVVSPAGGVPAGASAVLLNVTVTNTSAASFLTLWPAGDPQPLASNLNWTAGQTVANSVTVKVGAGGALSVLNSAGSVDVIIDVSGYYTDVSNTGFASVTPARIEDSRAASAVGPFTTPWGPQTTRDVVVSPAGGVPAGADAVLLNVTVTNTSAASFLTLWPAGDPQPLASNLNWTAGQTVANSVTVKVGAGGTLSVFNSAGTVDVIIDIAGYYTVGRGDLFHPTTPIRIQDSRPDSSTGPYTSPWGAGTTRPLAPTLTGAVPSYATAIVSNVTITGATAPSFLTLWPGGQPQPLASNLNWTAGRTVPNAVTTGLGQEQVLVYNASGSVDVIVDVCGYFAPPL